MINVARLHLFYYRAMCSVHASRYPQSILDTPLATPVLTQPHTYPDDRYPPLFSGILLIWPSIRHRIYRHFRRTQPACRARTYKLLARYSNL